MSRLYDALRNKKIDRQAIYPQVLHMATLDLHPRSREFALLLDGVMCWQEVHDRIIGLPKADRGPAFEAVMGALLVVDPACRIVDAWFPAEKAPPHLLHELGMPPSDVGGDGIAVDLEGRRIVVQFRFRFNPGRLSWGSLATFLGVSDKADVRLLITTASGTDEVAAKRPGFGAMVAADLHKMPQRRLAAAAVTMRSAPSHAIRTAHSDTGTPPVRRAPPLSPRNSVKKQYAKTPMVKVQRPPVASEREREVCRPALSTLGGTAKERALATLREGGLMTTGSLVRAGVPRYVLPRLVDDGLIERIGQRGFYRLVSAVGEAKETWSSVVAEYLGHRATGDGQPAVALKTAGIAHGLLADTGERSLWLAYPRGKRVRNEDKEVAGLKLLLVTMDPHMLTDESGIDVVRFGDRLVRMTSVERTIIDLLRFSRLRSLDGSTVVSPDDAEAALKAGLERGGASRAELERIASISPRCGWMAEHIRLIGRVLGR